MESTKPRHSCRLGRWISLFTWPPRSTRWAKWLVAVLFIPAWNTAGAEWMHFLPQAQWKRPLGELSSDVQAVQLAGHYAYLADANHGLEVIDVNDPASPQWVGGYETGGIPWNLVTRDGLVYLADLKAGFVVIDVTVPSEPRRLGVYAVSALGVAVQGIYAYLACGTNGVHVLDLSDPASPRRVGSCTVPGEAYAIAVREDHAYVADFRAGLLIVIDIQNAGAPRVIGTSQVGLYPTDVGVAGQYACVAAGTSGLSIWDIGDPTHVKPIGKWQEDCIVGRLSLSGSLIFLTVGVCHGDVVQRAVRVVDLAQPRSPVRVGGYEGIGARGLTTTGDYLYVADEIEGLQVIQVTQLPAFRSQSVVDREMSLVWNEAATGFTLQRTTGLPGGTWEDVPNSETTNRWLIPLASSSQFFRLWLHAPELVPNQSRQPTAAPLDSGRR